MSAAPGDTIANAGGAVRAADGARQPEVLVVGLGAMGSATLLQLARRGVDVLGIDRYAPPHEFGSSHGETRITREAVGEGAAFVPLARRSHQLWREFERETGKTLFDACGGLILARSGQASHMHERSHFLDNTIALAREFGIAHELLDAHAVRSRFPQLVLQGDETAYFEPGAGYLRPEACVDAQLQLARASGARIHTGEQVRAVRREGVRAIVETDRATYSPGVTIVCAGPWLPELLGDALPCELVVRRQVFYWFETHRSRSTAANDGARSASDSRKPRGAAMPDAAWRDDVIDYTPARCPIFIWNWGGGPTDVFYGFPDIGSGVKVATEQIVDAATPDTVERGVSAAEIAAMKEMHMRGRLRGLEHCVRTGTCLYTCAPHANFVIDRLPQCPGVIVVSACSGHGFKHSAAIGEAVAQMAAGSSTPEVLAPFRFASV